MRCPSRTRPAAFARRVAALTALVLGGCVFVPKTVDLYDGECQTAWRQMALEPVQIAAIGACNQGDCAAQLVVVGAVAAASAVVSGSIVIVGNVVYWMEKQGRCVRRTLAPAPRGEPGPSEDVPMREAASPSNP